MPKTPTAADIRRIQRTADDTEAAVKRIRAEEGYVQREAAQYNWRTSETLFGTSAHRPDSNYLKNKGTQSLIYYATDTGVLSAWDGAAWKSVTLV